MKRMTKFRGRREMTKVQNVIMACGTLFLIGTLFSYAYFMDKENDRIRDFIKNYDKERKVYYLQKDLFGGY